MRPFSAVISLALNKPYSLLAHRRYQIAGPLTCRFLQAAPAIDDGVPSDTLESIANQYDAFILDQFGVLHNGSVALPGAVEAVKYLYDIGKKLVILSNTSAPAEGALERLPKYGYRPEWFEAGAVTSGEEASKFLAQKSGSKVVFLTWDDRLSNNPRLTASPQRFLERANIQVAETIECADFLVLHGSEVWNRGASVPPIALGEFIDTGVFDDTVDDLLKRCAARKLPMVCANPDERVVTPTGGVAYMPGGLAKRYKELSNAECHIFGKPDPKHFRACVNKLGTERVIHVGDSMRHDIAGATEASIDSLFITSGIHADELSVEDFGVPAKAEKLEVLYREHGGIEPTFTLPAFRLTLSK